MNGSRFLGSARACVWDLQVILAAKEPTGRPVKIRPFERG